MAKCFTFRDPISRGELGHITAGRVYQQQHRLRQLCPAHVLQVGQHVPGHVLPGQQAASVQRVWGPGHDGGMHPVLGGEHAHHALTRRVFEQPLHQGQLQLFWGLNQKLSGQQNQAQEQVDNYSKPSPDYARPDQQILQKNIFALSQDLVTFWEMSYTIYNISNYGMLCVPPTKRHHIKKNNIRTASRRLFSSGDG